MPKNSPSDSVAERRLRPIYDWLDNGNNKKALQEADKVLKKHPEFECCQVLRCLALMRLGREGEASEILDKVLEARPTDEGALNAMTIAFRELQEPGKICMMYEGAVSKEPRNEEFLTHLFMSYVRMGEYKKQEEAARNLYKVKPKNPYFFWSVMSQVLQAIEGDPGLGKAIHLPLAHKKVQKMAQEDKMEQEQEVLLYILVLELREAWQEALTVLDGKLGRKLAASASYRQFYRSKRLQFELATDNWAEVGRLAREELEVQPDQWAAYKNYLEAVHRLESSSTPGPPPAAPPAPQAAPPASLAAPLTREAAIEFVTAQQASHPTLRGPWLAELELVSVLGEQAATSSSLILQYFEKFGTKHVAFSDLRPYVAALAREQQQEVVAELTAHWQAEPASPAEIYRDVNLRALQRFSGGHACLTPSQAEAEVASLVARWRAVEPLVAGLLTTDLRPSDSYLVLAAHLLWDLWRAQGTSRYFLQAATVLHLGMAASPSNWQLKLLLIRLYGAAGCGSVSAGLQGDLDIKHLMLDSLGWLLPRQLWGSGHLEAALAQLGATLRLYHHVNKDTADHIITAYRSGTFYQIRDIYRLRARITHSHHYATVDTERLLLQLLTDVREPGQAAALLSGPELQLGVEEAEWARLEDNRDLSTMVSWDPPELEVQAGQVEVSFRLEVMWARGRHLLLRCLSASLALCESPSSPPALTSLLTALRSHWDLCLQTSGAVLPPALQRPQAPEVPRLVPYTSSGQMAPLLLIMETIPALALQPQDPAPALSSLRSATALLPGLLQGLEVQECGASLAARGAVMEQVMWRLETVGLVVTLVGGMAAMFRGPEAKGKKGKKGKPPVLAVFQPLVEDFLLLQEAVDSLAVKLGAVVQELDSVLKESSLASSLDLLGLAVEEGRLGEAVQEGEQGREVLSRMDQSYVSSIQQMTRILENKRKYLSLCKISL